MSKKWLAVAACIPVIAGCSSAHALNTDERATRACGEGNVAYVDADDGQFLCKPIPLGWMDAD